MITIDEPEEKLDSHIMEMAKERIAFCSPEEAERQLLKCSDNIYKNGRAPEKVYIRNGQSLKEFLNRNKKVR